MLCECLDCKIFCLRRLGLDSMVRGSSINVQGLVANLGENLTDEHHLVYFFALGNPSQPVAVPALVQEMRGVQAGDQDASDPFFPGPC